MKTKLTTNIFVERANLKHNNFYNYSKANYTNSHNLITITCPVHGEFEQLAYQHLNGSGCPKCKSENCRFTKKQFIDKAKLIHNNKYDYSKVEYKNSQTKVIIICPTHGEFKQIPSEHLRSVSCPKCKSSKGEIKIRQWLLSNNIKFEEQYRFEDCKNKKPLPFDFYLSDYNSCIEYNGIQHYTPRDSWGGRDALEQVQQNDQIKTKYCENNKIKLLRIPYWKISNIERILNKKFL